MDCPICKGTGLVGPRMDSNCFNPACSDGQVKEVPRTPRFSDDSDDACLVHDLCECLDLTKWEIDFCNSVCDRMDEGKDLTEKQRDKIREILNENRKRDPL
jgi:hypothetical protein